MFLSVVYKPNIPGLYSHKKTGVFKTDEH